MGILVNRFQKDSRGFEEFPGRLGRTLQVFVEGRDKIKVLPADKIIVNDAGQLGKNRYIRRIIPVA